MKRYTVRFQGGDGGAEPRAALDRHLFGALPVYALGADAAAESGGWQIEVGTDADPAQCRRVLAAFAEQQGLRLAELRWGWLLSREVTTPSPPPALPPGGEERRVRLRPVLVFLGSVAVYALVLTWLLLGQASDPLLATAVIGLPFAWSLVFGRSEAIFTRVSAVRLDAAGIAVAYWLLPGRLRLAWREVDALKMDLTGSGCQLRAGPRRAGLPLKLLGNRDDTRQLLRTIVDAAGLVLAEDLPMGGAIYRRPELG